MPKKSTQTVTKVLVPILIQDPSVLASDDWEAVTIHPSGATCESGFFDGPACERVAIVDFDVDTGELRQPARLVAGGSKYRNVGSYQVEPPARGKRGPIWQLREQQYTDLDRLNAKDFLEDPFMKVSVFGTVIRTLGFMESAVGFARRTNWAFGRQQLLVVPAAGEYENAYYHRESGSLRFFYFAPIGGEIPRIYTALSQDVIVHETAHALIDAVAPDLYNAITPDSLAIHEGIADITAALVTVLNREFGGKPKMRAAQFINDLSTSNRYSQFAEQFGAKARGQDTLRELLNNRRLGDDESNPDVVDPTSPHMLSEVISGALFGVLQKTAMEYEKDAPQDPFRAEDKGGRHGLGAATAGRIASLTLKGLDWLPPGDISLGDYARSILAADRYHLPNHDEQRQHLIQELVRRGVIRAGGLNDVDNHDSLGPIDFEKLLANKHSLRSFVHKHRMLLGIPEGVAFELPQVFYQRNQQRAMRAWCRGDTMANLDRPTAPVTSTDAELLIIKVAWWVTEPNALGPYYGMKREVKVGTTLVIDRNGTVYARLRGGQEPELAGRRDRFLQRQAKLGVLLAPHQVEGPDGQRLMDYVHAVPHPNGTRFVGGLRSLHLVGEVP